MPDASMKEWTVQRFLEAVASDKPVPGGGAVAVVADPTFRLSVLPGTVLHFCSRR